jgi:hypothetical protein
MPNTFDSILTFSAPFLTLSTPFLTKSESFYSLHYSGYTLTPHHKHHKVSCLKLLQNTLKIPQSQLHTSCYYFSLSNSSRSQISNLTISLNHTIHKLSPLKLLTLQFPQLSSNYSKSILNPFLHL